MSRKTKPVIGILTGGGDCPGLNAAIRAVVRRAAAAGYQTRGFIGGWRGLLEQDTRELSTQDVVGIVHRGGTILQSSRTNPFQDKPTERLLWKSLKSQALTALIVIGGEDTLGVAARVATHGYPVIGIPKTIDNDLPGTEQTIGFDTAVNVAMEAMDRLHTTAESHNRIIVVEVMGRHAGWIATYAGLAAGADDILIPEMECHIAEIAALIQQRHARGRNHSILVVAEGARLMTMSADGLVLSSEQKDAFGHVRLGGVGEQLATRLEAYTGFDCRAVVLGHLQRGGSPTAFDRILATRFGVYAVELALQARFGRLVAWRKGQVSDVALAQVRKKIRCVDPSVYKVAQTFFG